MTIATRLFTAMGNILSRPFACLGLTFACIAAESWTTFDQAAQIAFFRDHAWLLSKAFHRAYGSALYTGPKIGIALIAVAALAVALGLSRKAPLAVRRDTQFAPWRKPCLLLALSICLVPLLAASLKAVTGVYGPVDLLPYGGGHPHIGFLDHLWTYGRPDTGRSFPAGHASGGFALMAAYYLPLRPGLRAGLCGAGFALGWLMGLYQMARGEHFLSHTLATMFLALAVIGLLARIVSPDTARPID